MEDSCPVSNAAQQAEAQRFRKQSKKIGRKLSRRLSLITKVPNIFNVKFAGAESPSTPHKIAHGVSATTVDDDIMQAHEITVIAPDKTQRLVSTYYLPTVLYIYPQVSFSTNYIRRAQILKYV